MLSAVPVIDPRDATVAYSVFAVRAEDEAFVSVVCPVAVRVPPMFVLPETVRAVAEAVVSVLCPSTVRTVAVVVASVEVPETVSVPLDTNEEVAVIVPAATEVPKREEMKAFVVVA